MRKPPIPRRSLLVFASTLAILLPFGGGSAALGTGAASIGVASTIANGQTLTGKVHWTATVSGISTNDVASVAFSIDGVSKWTEKQSPYEYNGTNGTLDTASLSNGSHVFAVVATAKDGSTATAAATATAKNPPQSTRRPSISGQLVAGKTLTAARGSWSGPGPISFSYRWLRCDSSGGSCAAISGAAGSTYTLGDADVGRRLRVVVTVYCRLLAPPIGLQAESQRSHW